MPESATAAQSEKEPAIDAELWAQVLTLPCQLTVDIPLPGFKVSHGLRLGRGSLIDSHWRVGTDIPLRLNGELIARGEFEVVGDRLAARLTELA
jgi:flagellar motor switch/type III secretory pathway protein FliN